MFDMKLFSELYEKKDINLVYLPECSSTNNYIKENRNQLSHMTVVLTDNQTKGRGRFERLWLNEPNKNIAMSLLLKDIALTDLSFYPILVSLSVSNALTSLTDKQFKIKWPNDILFNNKKICGILCESQIRGNTANIIIGIGLNIGSDKDFYQNNGLDFAGSVYSETGILLPVEKAAAAVIQSIITICSRYKNGEKIKILDEYRTLCVTLGRYIKYNEIDGRAEDINADGSLKVILNDGRTENITDASVVVQGIYHIK